MIAPVISLDIETLLNLFFIDLYRTNFLIEDGRCYVYNGKKITSKEIEFWFKITIDRIVNETQESCFSDSNTGVRYPFIRVFLNLEIPKNFKSLSGIVGISISNIASKLKRVILNLEKNGELNNTPGVFISQSICCETKP